MVLIGGNFIESRAKNTWKFKKIRNLLKRPNTQTTGIIESED